MSVVDIVDVGSGVLQNTTGFAEFNIIYKAVVFKPFKNQVVDGVVTTVNKVQSTHLVATTYSHFATPEPWFDLVGRLFAWLASWTASGLEEDWRGIYTDWSPDTRVLQIFTHTLPLSTCYFKMGFFADVGPLQVFVSSHVQW